MMLGISAWLGVAGMLRMRQSTGAGLLLRLIRRMIRLIWGLFWRLHRGLSCLRVFPWLLGRLPWLLRVLGRLCRLLSSIGSLIGHLRPLSSLLWRLKPLSGLRASRCAPLPSLFRRPRLCLRRRTGLPRLRLLLPR